MDKLIRSYLAGYSQYTITLKELEGQVPGHASYADFAAVINKLLHEGVLLAIKSQGMNQATPELPNKFKIRRQKLNAALFEEIRSQELHLHPLIRLDRYFKLTPTLWHQEEPWRELLNRYLNAAGLPTKEASVWERSLQIFGDEKLISDRGGKAFLRRVGIYDKLRIVEMAEPLMFAVNPRRIKERCCYHLIVENKTTFDALADVLADTEFLTLIYGAGKSIINSIAGLEKQLNLPDAEHVLFYFGDMDLEGITIWYGLNQRRCAGLALPFYRALLTKSYSIGKENQRKNEEAYQAFVANFSMAEQNFMDNLFMKHGYYPQEALTAQELQHIWRSTVWTHI